MRATIEINDLRFFTVLAVADSFGAAARKLGVKTPAVSKHLTKMEGKVGVSLLFRTTRRMSLTPEGVLFLKHAQRVLSEIESLQEMLDISSAK